MVFISEKNIARFSFLYAIIVVAVLVFSTGALLIGRKSQNLETELAELELNFIEDQKIQLKTDVSDLIERIDNRRLWSSARQENELTQEVEEARKIAVGLHTKFKKQIDRQKLEKVIKEAIRPIRFHEKEGYCFILSESGQALLYPAEPELEGKNLFAAEVGGDPEVIDNMITIARERGQGIFRYDWWKPGGNSEEKHQKIAYITWFEPYNWVIGSGEYLNTLTAITKTSITSELKKSLKEGNNGYYFIYDIHNLQGGDDFATILINNNRPDLVNKKISDDYKDAKGRTFRKEFLEGIRENGEAYVIYWYKKPGGKEISRKLSYFKLYPEWNWVIARGVYFDRLDSVVASKKADLRQKVRKDIQILLFFFLAALSIALLVAYHFAGQLQEIFNRYRNEKQNYLSELEQLKNTLEQQYRTDPLTNIHNRAYLTTRFEEEKKRTIRYNNPLSVVLFDIDHFKKVNDSYGHIAGDEILKELSQLVGENIRAADTFGRWGGEEFLILAPGIDIHRSLQMAEKLRKLIANHTFSTKIQVTCSFGVSCCKTDEESQATLLRADDALNKAKQSGHNQSVAI